MTDLTMIAEGIENIAFIVDGLSKLVADGSISPSAFKTAVESLQNISSESVAGVLTGASAVSNCTHRRLIFGIWAWRC
jgi:hypothetical protein